MEGVEVAEDVLEEKSKCCWKELKPYVVFVWDLFVWVFEMCTLFVSIGMDLSSDKEDRQTNGKIAVALHVFCCVTFVLLPVRGKLRRSRESCKECIIRQSHCLLKDLLGFGKLCRSGKIFLAPVELDQPMANQKILNTRREVNLFSQIECTYRRIPMLFLQVSILSERNLGFKMCLFEDMVRLCAICMPCLSILITAYKYSQLKLEHRPEQPYWTKITSGLTNFATIVHRIYTAAFLFATYWILGLVSLGICLVMNSAVIFIFPVLDDTLPDAVNNVSRNRRYVLNRFTNIFCNMGSHLGSFVQFEVIPPDQNRRWANLRVLRFVLLLVYHCCLFVCSVVLPVVVYEYITADCLSVKENQTQVESTCNIFSFLDHTSVEYKTIFSFKSAVCLTFYAHLLFGVLHSFAEAILLNQPLDN